MLSLGFLTVGGGNHPAVLARPNTYVPGATLETLHLLPPLAVSGYPFPHLSKGITICPKGLCEDSERGTQRLWHRAQIPQTTAHKVKSWEALRHGCERALLGAWPHSGHGRHVTL